jgi:glutathione S-transferase
MTRPILLYQFPRGPGRLPNPSPFCMKLEGYLRLSGRPFRVVEASNPRRAPKGQMPFVEINGRRVGDSNLIIAELEAAATEPVDGWLDARQKALAHLVVRTLEDHFHWASVYARWVDPEGFPAWRRAMAPSMGMPAFVLGPMMTLARRLIARRVRGHGLGRHGPEEIYRLAEADLAAAAAVLEDKPFLFGDRLAVADLALAAFVGGVVEMPWQGGLDRALAGHPALPAHYERVLAVVFADRAAGP